jgi:hypothetical protein
LEFEIVLLTPRKGLLNYSSFFSNVIGLYLVMCWLCQQQVQVDRRSFTRDFLRLGPPLLMYDEKMLKDHFYAGVVLSKSRLDAIMQRIYWESS